MDKRFGQLLKELRLREGFGLRRFAELVEIKPSNLSAIEHGRRSAPNRREKLCEIAEALGLVEGSERWDEFFDAARNPGEFPADVQHMADNPRIPVLLRTVDNKNLTDSEIEKLIKEVQRR